MVVLNTNTNKSLEMIDVQAVVGKAARSMYYGKPFY